MSLSKYIIYSDVENVRQALTSGVALDEIDEYGYTPLVQTAIMDSLEKAELLLQAGADVNFIDLTGRSALHWAADNGNEKICKLLLEHGANANSYTLAGQPALVMPYLRDNQVIKNIMYRGGASLNFAQDFIAAKLLGHRHELEGRVDLVDPNNTFFEIEFEGFYLEFSLAMVARSLQDFRNNFGGKHLRPFFRKLNHILHLYHTAQRLLKYQHYLIDISQYEQAINALINQSILLLPISYSGHAITMIRFFDWLIRCDRGEYGRDHGTVIIYKMNKPEYFSSSLIKNLLYRRQDKQFINEGLASMLALQPIGQIPLSVQLTGNCSWANVEAVVPAMMFLLFMQESQKQQVVHRQKVLEDSLMFYEEWTNWDKSQSLHKCVETFYRVEPVRKASYASMLAAILFQRCQHDNEDDRIRAEKMLKILMIKEYRYIIRAYFETLGRKPSHPLVKNVLGFFDDFGIDPEIFG